MTSTAILANASCQQFDLSIPFGLSWGKLARFISCIFQSFSQRIPGINHFHAINKPSIIIGTLNITIKWLHIICYLCDCINLIQNESLKKRLHRPISIIIRFDWCVGIRCRDLNRDQKKCKDFEMLLKHTIKNNNYKTFFLRKKKRREGPNRIGTKLEQHPKFDPCG